jgi:hypothetical protein
MECGVLSAQTTSFFVRSWTTLQLSRNKIHVIRHLCSSSVKQSLMLLFGRKKNYMPHETLRINFDSTVLLYISVFRRSRPFCVWCWTITEISYFSDSLNSVSSGRFAEIFRTNLI